MLVLTIPNQTAQIRQRVWPVAAATVMMLLCESLTIEPLSRTGIRMCCKRPEPWEWKSGSGEGQHNLITSSGEHYW